MKTTLCLALMLVLFSAFPARATLFGQKEIWNNKNPEAPAVPQQDLEKNRILFEVTFFVNMTPAADFDPQADTVYLTGNWFDWPEPGDLIEEQMFIRVENTNLWTKTYQLEAGEYHYKYFLNAGWFGGEYPGEPNRQITVNNDMVVHNVWGSHLDIDPEEYFAGGFGTAVDPWLISTPDHLNNIRNFTGQDFSGKFFKLIADINLDEEPWNQGNGWEPIGGNSEEDSFFGNLDGNGHKIFNLFIQNTSGQYAGLIGINDGIISDLIIESGDITSSSAILGGIAGYNRSGSIIDCSISGTIESLNTVGIAGGLAGLNEGEITRSWSSAQVRGKGMGTGGLVGHNVSGIISESFSNGEVKGFRHTGGLAGLLNNEGQIINSYSTAQVTGQRYTGGLTGLMRYGTILNSFSSGLVRGVGDTGGMVGCYTGINEESISGSYWNIETSGQDLSSGGHGGTISQMTQQGTYENWDFNTWGIEEGSSHPFLQWEIPSASHHFPAPAHKIVFEISNDEGQEPDIASITLGGNQQSQGDYVFAVLPGTYSWDVYLPGYQPMSGNVEVTDQDVLLNLNAVRLPTGTLTDIDGNTYQTIFIGDQEWMAENLKVTKFKNGELIPEGNGIEGIDPTLGYFFVYDDDPENIPDYGLLYSGSLINDARGLCPTGWSVPTAHQWAFMETQIGIHWQEAIQIYNNPLLTGTQEGGKLKGKGTDFWVIPNVGATDVVNFRALPGGYRVEDYAQKGISAYFHINSNTTTPFIKSLNFNHSKISTSTASPFVAASIRCIKESSEHSTPTVATGEVITGQQNEFWLNGTIMNDGDTPVKGKGFVFGTIENPELSFSGFSFHIFAEGNEADFSAVITGLNFAQTYYARAFAVNAKGISYGEQVSFVPTESFIPSPSITVTDIESTSFNLKSTAYAYQGQEILTRGFVWSTGSYPTLADNIIDTGNEEGEITLTLDGLTPNKNYYVRAFVTFPEGSSYSANKHVRTLNNNPLPEALVNGIEIIGPTTVSVDASAVATADLGILDKGVIIYGYPYDGYFFENSSGPGEGDFTIAFSNLQPNKEYLAIAFAANEHGRVPSNNHIRFRTGFENTEQANQGMEDIYRNLYLPQGYNSSENFGLKSFDLTNDVMGDDLVLNNNAFADPFLNHYRYIAHRNKNYVLVTNTWNRFLKIINETNFLLNNIDDASGDQTDKDRLKGEALALRAFAHFNLVQVFSHTYGFNPNARGVPYLGSQIGSVRNEQYQTQDKEPGFSQTNLYPSTEKTRNQFFMNDPLHDILPIYNVSETYTFIIEDLENAISLLENAALQPDRSRIDLAVANGLRARVALVMEDWEGADFAAQQGIESSENQGRTLFTTSTYNAAAFNSANASEWLWGAELSNEEFPDNSFFNHIDANTFYYASNRVQKKITAALYNAHSSTDVRKTLYIAPGEGLGQLVDYNQMKFLLPSETPGVGDYLYMRLGELYLIRAEALARAGNFEQAQTILYSLISQRDPEYTISTATGEELINEILLHRRLELWGEGHRHLDLRRMQKPLERPTGAGNHTQNHAMVMEVEANDDLLVWVMPYYYNLEIEKDGNGNVLLNNQSFEYPVLVNRNTTIRLEAIPETNWQFLRWTVDGEVIGTEPILEYTMPLTDITIKADFLNVTSIHEVTADNLKVYPNPARSELWVEFFNPENRRVDLLLTNLQGQLVGHQVVDEAGKVTTRFNVSGLQPGVYLMIVRNQKMNMVRKIVIQN